MNEKTQIHDLQPLRLDSITPLHREDTSLIGGDDAFDIANIPDSEQSQNELTQSSLNQRLEPHFFPLATLQLRSEPNMLYRSHNLLQPRKSASLENDDTHEMKISKIGVNGTTFLVFRALKLLCRPPEVRIFQEKQMGFICKASGNSFCKRGLQALYCLKDFNSIYSNCKSSHYSSE